uniref:Farnesoic acid O-methyl transferase domain-containing protein n=1 Tax=Anopheles culicifacies TaxID=139723 RepID=A0A182MU46_9DIPT
MHRCSFRPFAKALLWLVLWLTIRPEQVASNGDFSYFYGVIAPTDTLCAKKVVGIGTKSPVQVDYSSKRPITAVSLDASNVAYQGFNALITRGGIGQLDITFSLNGPWVFPYYIELDYYCKAPDQH